MKICGLNFKFRGKSLFIGLYLGFFSFLDTASAQIANYVINPSFELASPGATFNPFYGAQFWGPMDSAQCSCQFLFSMSPPLSSAPHNSTGFQFPRTGKNYILSSFFCPTCHVKSNRWYVKNRLKKALKANTTYCIKYHIVNTNNSHYAISDYGAYCGGLELDTISYCSGIIDYLQPSIQYSGGIITDTLNWTAISGTFMAAGGERYLALGNFVSDAATHTLVISTTYTDVVSSDIYIDDVSLFEKEMPAYAGPDKPFFYVGDGVFIGREPDIELDESCIWYQMTSPTTSITLDTIAGLWVKPVQTTTYVVRQQLWCSGVKWDTVVVYKDGVGLEKLRMIENQLSIYPNPANDILELQLPDQSSINEFNSTLILNALSQVIREQQFDIDPTPIVNVKDLPEGIYTLELRHSELGIVRKRFVIAR